MNILVMDLYEKGTATGTKVIVTMPYNMRF